MYLDVEAACFMNNFSIDDLRFLQLFWICVLQCIYFKIITLSPRSYLLVLSCLMLLKCVLCWFSHIYGFVRSLYVPFLLSIISRDSILSFFMVNEIIHQM